MKNKLHILLYLSFVICLSCKSTDLNTAEVNSNSVKHLIEKETIEDDMIKRVDDFSLEVFNNCYAHEFPKVNKDIATDRLLSEWKETKTKFIYACEKYGHKYGKLKSLNLIEVLSDKNNNKSFRYKGILSTRSKTIEIRILTTSDDKFDKIIFIPKWSEEYKEI